MTEPVQVLDYTELMSVVRERVAAIGAPVDIVEEVAGMSRGYLGAILGRSEDKHMGMFVIWRLLETLGLRLMISEHLDVAATRDEMGNVYRLAERKGPRRGGLRKQISPAIASVVMRELGRKGGLKGKGKRYRLPACEISRINRENVGRRKWRPVRDPAATSLAAEDVEIQASR